MENHDLSGLREEVVRLQERLIAQRDIATLALTNSEKAINKAEVATEKRFEGVNEFRKTLEDYQMILLSKAEAELRFRAIEDKINILTESQTLNSGRRSGSEAIWAYVVAAAGVLFGVISFFK